MSNVVTAKQNEYQNVLNTANLVFNLDFKELIPKLYTKENFSPQSHYLVKENEEICALVGSFKNKLSILDTTLNIGGIGTVSVHPNHRGKGYMKDIIPKALDDMKKDGIHLAYLDGNRKRYEYFSFTPSGIDANFIFDTANIKHCFVDINKNISFKEVFKTDIDIIKDMFNLFSKKLVKAQRDIHDFYDIILSWKSIPYAVFNGNKFIGYLICKHDKNTISEFELINLDDVTAVISSYLNHFKIDSVLLSHIPIYEKDKIKLYSEICSSYNISHSKSFAIFNFRKVIYAFLKLKSRYTKLDDGIFIIEIINNQKVKISVQNNIINVSNTSDNADISLPYLKAVQYIFGCHGIYDTNILNNNWFPLPLHFDTQDSV